MRERYAAYKRGEVDETAMCGEMVTMHRGISEESLLSAAAASSINSSSNRSFPKCANWCAVCSETGCEVWAVSSSNEWVIRAGMKYFGIPENHILAAKVHLDRGSRYGSTDPRAFWQRQT